MYFRDIWRQLINKFYFITLCICCLAHTQTFATPVLFFGGQLLEKDSVAIIIQDFVLNFKEVHHSSSKSKVYNNNPVCFIEYGTNVEDLFCQVILQYNYKKLQFKSNEREITRKTNGIGDTFFQLLWRPINYMKEDVISRLFLVGGFIAPTGDFNQQDKYTKEFGDIGRLLEPGTGNWALDLELYYGYFSKNLEFNVGIAYYRFFDGHHYRFGSPFMYYFSCLPTIYTFKINGKDLKLTAGLEFIGIVSPKDRDHGSKVQNTGGSNLNFLPAVQLNYPHIQFSMGYFIHGYARLNRDVNLPEPVKLNNPSWTIKGVYYTTF